MKFYKKTIRDVPLEGSTVLLRADYNVPLTAEGKIDDDFRIRASLPTINELRKDNCKIVIIAHLGRPEGNDPSLSLEPIAERLTELLGEKVLFVDQTIGEKVRMTIKKAPGRSIILLENLRFFKEEEANDESFAKALARDSGARFFVQDGFGVVHRDHASTAAITLFLPSVAGLLLEKEYSMITKSMKKPDRPFAAVMGGAKVSDKIHVIDEFVAKADRILIGGAMANTFLAYKGYNLGSSKYETDQFTTIKAIYDAAEEKVGRDNVDEFLLHPTDVATAKRIDAAEPRHNKKLSEITEDDIILDVGDKTIESYVKAVESSKTVIWNGTLGYAELPQFAHGSARISLALATNPEIESIIGGGDTADFVIHWDGKHGESFSHVSTGGGASLELMAGEKLPGVEHLLDA